MTGEPSAADLLALGKLARGFVPAHLVSVAANATPRWSPRRGTRAIACADAAEFVGVDGDAMSERSELMPAASASEPDGDGVRGRSPRGAMSERSELMPAARAPASRTAMGSGGAAREDERSQRVMPAGERQRVGRRMGSGRSPRGAMSDAVDRAVLAVLLAAASGFALWNAFDHGLVLGGTAAGAVIGFAAGWEVARQWWRGAPARSSVCSRRLASSSSGSPP